MSQHLPNLVDPWRLADLGRRFAGRIRIEQLSRLAQIVVEPSGETVYELEFFRDGQRRSCIRGKVAADLRLQCQRCLEPMDYPVRSELSLALVRGIAEIESLPDRYDPLLIDDTGTIRPQDVIEDELLLALPQVAMHGPDQCGISQQAVQGTQAVTGGESPFAVLADLKRK